jgi:hypothetical protein
VGHVRSVRVPIARVVLTRLKENCREQVVLAIQGLMIKVNLNQSVGVHFNCSLVCDATCKECHTTAKTCSFCDGEKKRILLKDACECKEGYFEKKEDRTCSPCRDECLSCTTANECANCKDIKRSIIDGDCKCKEVYYVSGESCEGIHMTHL